MTTPWTVEPEWQGETAAILASGPSMTREQADHVRGKCRVIAVNNQGIDTVDSTTGELVPALAPWADILYAADAKWWRNYHDRALKFAGRKVTIKDTLPWDDVFNLKQSIEHPTFDPRPTHLANGGNSGYQAIHLAVHLGATRIVLLGFDMKNGANRRRHWFGSHPGRLDSRGSFPAWIHAMEKLSRVLERMGVEVINCTPGSALRCFRRGKLEEVLP